MYPRELFELQVDFAERFYKKLGLSRESGYFRLTSFFVRILGHDYAKFPVETDQRWQRIIKNIPKDPKKTCDYFYELYIQSINIKEVEEKYNLKKFGCFHYFENIENNKLQLHFDPIDKKGNLSKERIEYRKAEINEMFEYIVKNEKSKTLYATTWLLNINSFNRLFPKSFSEDAKLWDSNNCFFDNSHWGQFVDRELNFKEDIAKEFRKNSDKDTQNLNELFPFPALIGEISIL